METPMIVSFNKDKITQFSYSLILKQELTDQNPVGIATYVDAFSFRQSLQRFSMGMEINFVDGTGMVDAGKLQVGNIIELTLYKTSEDKEKIIKNFYITNIEDSIQTTKPNERMFTIKAYTFPAISDAWPLLEKFAADTPTNMLKKIVETRFVQSGNKIGETIPPPGLEWVESTQNIEGGLFFHQISKSQAIKQLLERIPEPETFFFFEDYQGFKLKTFASMVEIGKQKKWNYVFYPTNQTIPNRQLEDYFRVLYLSQYTHSDFFKLMKSGALRGELVMIDLKNKKVESKKQLSFLDEKKDILVLGPNEPVKIDQRIFGNAVPFNGKSLEYDYTPASKIAISENAWERQDYLIDGFLKKRAQRALMDQTQITIEVYGNHAIRPGDIVNLDVPSRTALKDAPNNTRRQTGDFIVGAVRHNISGTFFQTYLDLYKDGYEEPVTEIPKG